ncbi:hypothetical protein GCQ56_17790 [Marinifilum sp. N1E240]|uniref:hypothetical protein n=1 Tax=Marinifilum sp. N1E240 TaxID=2608082 RepID=UPI00128CF553|nr:hypothetical protein [Marinifilum sp. N1E240]MPQ48856.1 hypothetical protein [Marinifilum sp. N1E240]
MVTIYTKDRERFFGEVLNGKMELSEIEKQANLFWNNIPLYDNHMFLGEYVIIPDHIHGIIGSVGDCKDVSLLRQPQKLQKSTHVFHFSKIWQFICGDKIVQISINKMVQVE